MINKPKTENEAIQEKLQEIKEQDGIIGYILRGSKSASIDLKDPKKIIEYASMSSTTFYESQNISEKLQMGEPEKILVESENSKYLSLNKNDQQVTIFMEKNVNTDKIYKELK